MIISFIGDGTSGSKSGLKYLVVAELPEIGEENVIYLVPKEDPKTMDEYDEYVWLTGKWENLGTSKIDLSQYYTKTETDSQINKAVSGKVDNDTYTAYTANTTSEIARKASQTDLNAVSGQVSTNTTDIATINSNKVELTATLEDGTTVTYNLLGTHA